MKSIWSIHDVWCGRHVIKRTHIGTSAKVEDHPFVVGFVHASTLDKKDEDNRHHYGLVDHTMDGMFINIGRSLEAVAEYLTEHGYIPAETLQPYR